MRKCIVHESTQNNQLIINEAGKTRKWELMHLLLYMYGYYGIVLRAKLNASASSIYSAELKPRAESNQGEQRVFIIKHSNMASKRALIAFLLFATLAQLVVAADR